MSNFEFPTGDLSPENSKDSQERVDDAIRRLKDLEVDTNSVNLFNVDSNENLNDEQKEAVKEYIKAALELGGAEEEDQSQNRKAV